MNSAEVLTAALATTGPARELLFDRAKELDLRERIIACTSCKLSESTTPVPFEGESSIAIVGEAPGADEARQGRPFIGRAGKLLEEVLGYAGFARSDVAFVNTISCRPPNNNFDKAEAVGADYHCTRNFWEQIEFTGAWLLVPVGNTAMWKLLPSIGAGITQMRGQIRWVDRYLIAPTFHPAYALRHPPAKSVMVDDFLQVKRLRSGAEHPPVPKSYNPNSLLSALRDQDPNEKEEAAYKAMFKKKGWVYAYSKWLEDTVILKRDDSVEIPPHVEGVEYTVNELVQLAAMPSRRLVDAQRLHYAKREFNARII